MRREARILHSSSILRLIIKLDVLDSYYKKESRLPSNIISGIISYIDERASKEISNLSSEMPFRLSLPPGISPFFSLGS